MTGGTTNEFNDVLDTSEMIRFSNPTRWETGPALPKRLYAACAVSISDTEIFLAGGNGYETVYHTEAYIYNK